MIQRIQTIYLLVAAISMAVVAFSPLMGLDGGLTLFSCGIQSGEDVVFHTWGIVSMAALTSLLSLLSVFLFKNRKRQASFVLITFILVLFYYVTCAVYMLSYGKGNLSELNLVPYIGIFLPIVALVTLLLARRSIKKDEKLVKSLDRIR